MILNIETSTGVCSVAVGRNSEIAAIRETTQNQTHSEQITLYIQQVLKEAGIEAQDLDAVAVSMGPGSYTGLRIGVSAAKGLCYAIDKPLIAVSTLQAMALKMQKQLEEVITGNGDDILLCPMIDARRMEVYAGFFNNKNELYRNISADVIGENSYAGILRNHRVMFFGSGSEKCRKILSLRANALFAENVFPSAAFMAPIAERAYREEKFENLAYFEPFYLKNFMPGPEKKI